MRFEGRAIYVTGAGHGIGRAIARRLAWERGAVAVSDIDAPSAQQVADEIVASGGTAFATTCDVTDSAAVETSFADALGRLGKLDISSQQRAATPMSRRSARSGTNSGTARSISTSPASCAASPRPCRA